MPVLVWFRNDLRIEDHPALAAAAATGEPLIACFLPADRQWQQHDWAPCKVAFVLAHVHELGRALGRLRIPLLIRRTARFKRAPQTIAALCREHGCRAVYANREDPVDERARDEAVAQRLARDDIPLHLLQDQCIIPPELPRTGQDTAYKVYTPFARRWFELLDDQGRQLHPTPARQAPLPGLGVEPVPEDLPAYRRAVFDERWTVGAAAIRKQLAAALEHRLRVYRDRRDQPAVDGTSRLSPYLACGALSARECLQAALAANDGSLRSGGIGTWVGELIWREFYRHILLHFPRVSRHRPFQEQTDGIGWRSDARQERAWQQGRTGIPIVDAGMRQMAACGWMHNRLRMVTAQFFSKNLLLDWRRGEAFFMRSLIDGDLANNNGGWQWSASTGTDAAPYFRVFNPVNQSRKHDPDGCFLRRYLPELAELDDRAIHDPTPDQRRACGYPEALVDLKGSRQRAIDAFRG